MSARLKCAGAYRGTLVHSISFGVIEFIDDGLIIVNAQGYIDAFYDLSNLPENLELSADDLLQSLKVEVYDLRGKLIIPGFVDGHAHAPQYAYAGTGMDCSLLQWLEKYTFPFEAKFKNIDFARLVYEKSVSRHLHYGTTTCSYFATVHLEASKVLVDVVKKYGQRGFIGKVSMDRNCPENLVESTEEAIRDVKLFVEYALSEGMDIASTSSTKGNILDNLIVPVITPRFVPTCTEELMKGLGDLSNMHKLPVQTHLSETLDEIAWVRELHPNCTSYLDVYDKCNLLHDRSYFAHCIHCSTNEIECLKLKGGSVIHCPSSNFILQSGICNVKSYIREGIKVGLGTDVAGGYSSSILDCIRQALIASRVCSKSSDESPLTFQEAFHLATQGGADALGIGHVIGNFALGKSFDALVITVRNSDSQLRLPFDMFPGQGMQEGFEKFLFLGDDRNIEQVYVNGARVV